MILEKEKGLSSFTLKLIAILAMTVDHAAWLFVPTQSFWGQTLHIIGRLTAPIMFFFIAEGYRHTRSVWKYAGRLFLFAAISTLPFSFYNTGKWSFYSFGIMYTLALGLLSIFAYDKIKNPIVSTLLIFILCAASLYGDWPILGVLFCLSFHIFHGHHKKQCIAIGLMSILYYVDRIITHVNNGGIFLDGVLANLFLLSIPLPIFILKFYNEEKRGKPSLRWIFYLYYPLHLIVIGVLFWNFK